MMRIFYLLSISLFCVALSAMCFAKPAEVLLSPESLNPVHSETNGSETTDTNREQRSPQFGLLNDYDDYSDYDDDSRHFKFGHKQKHHNLHHKPIVHPGGHGCHGYGCGGGYPGHGGYYPHGGQGGTFATASAGSLNTGGKPFGGHSQANAQSASFSFGPYTATFSVAQSSSGRQRF